MACLGLEPRAAWWKVQTNPLSFCHFVWLIHFNLFRTRVIMNESPTPNSTSTSLLLSTSTFADESVQIFFEFILHGVVLNLVGLVRLPYSVLRPYTNLDVIVRYKLYIQLRLHGLINKHFNYRTSQKLINCKVHYVHIFWSHWTFQTLPIIEVTSLSNG